MKNHAMNCEAPIKPVSRRHGSRIFNGVGFPSPRRWFVRASGFNPWRFETRRLPCVTSVEKCDIIDEKQSTGAALGVCSKSAVIAAKSACYTASALRRNAVKYLLDRSEAYLARGQDGERLCGMTR